MSAELLLEMAGAWVLAASLTGALFARLFHGAARHDDSGTHGSALS